MMGGENGYYARKDVLAALEVKQAELEALQTTRENLDKKVSLMAPDNLDRDLLDEQARHILGLAGKDELVIFLDEDEPPESKKTEESSGR
jgi:cell division protein FtsB